MFCFINVDKCEKMIFLVRIADVGGNMLAFMPFNSGPLIST